MCSVERDATKRRQTARRAICKNSFVKDELRRQSVGQSGIDTKRTARDNDFQVGCINATLPAADHLKGFVSLNSAPKEELQDALGPRAGLPAIPVVPYVVGTVMEDTPLNDLAAVNLHCN